MMSRLAIYPLLGSALVFLGRKSVPATHLFIGGAVALFPAVSLLWGHSIVGGIPFAVRWFSFGMMIIGFSGTISRWGLRSHLTGLVAAAVLTAAVIVLAGADRVTGNANRAGMILATGFTASLVVFKKNKWFSWAASVIIAGGLYYTFFYIGWIAAATGTAVFFLSGRLKIKAWYFLVPMIAGQMVFSAFPEYAGRIGPTLELRARIWNNSFDLFKNHLPLGTGIGSARLEVFNSAEPELRSLAGADRRIDYLHSEPLTMAVETGVPGLVLLLLILYWLQSKSKTRLQLAMLAAFWTVFTSDLPLATPLGALPAALFLGSVTPMGNKKHRIPTLFPVTLGVFSLVWGYAVITGYSALGHGTADGSRAAIERACNRIPWEERAFLTAGYIHIRGNMLISAMEDSETFLELYPEYYRGWELRATVLDATGRQNSSAWARAALLAPEQAGLTDRYLFALNAVSATGMDADTAVAVSVLISYAGRDYTDLVGSMTQQQQLLVAQKLYTLSEQCRPASMYHAARVWFMAMGTAVKSGGPVPDKLALNLIDAVDLFRYLDQDWKPKGEEYLGMIEGLLGMEPARIPSP